VTFFLDENLGLPFAKILLEAGINVELHNSHFDPGVPDIVWIPTVAAKGWIGVTLDIQTRFNPREIEAIVTSKARILHLKGGPSTTHPMLATNFVQTFTKILRFLESNSGPCLATITRPSKKEDYFAGKPGNVNPQTKRIKEVQERLT
jgi:PIN like domain